MKSATISLFFITLSCGIFAQTSTPTIKSTAIAYMEAYGDWDFDKMKTFFAEDIHFEDPTGSEAFGQPFVYNGKENVYDFFNGVFKDRFENNRPPYVNFIIEKNFVSGSIVVINSTFECIIPTSWYKENSEEKVLVSFPFLTILHIENGKIKRHMDYGDYTKYLAQIKAQL